MPYDGDAPHDRKEPAHDRHRPLAYCWVEYNAKGPVAARAFFTGLFSYRAEALDFGPDYTIFHLGEGEDSDTFFMCDPGDLQRPYFQPFFSVTDVDATFQQALALGAKAMCPPMDMGRGRFAHLEDPFGATFALFQLATD